MWPLSGCFPRTRPRWREGQDLVPVWPGGTRTKPGLDPPSSMGTVACQLLWRASRKTLCHLCQDVRLKRWLTRRYAWNSDESHGVPNFQSWFIVCRPWQVTWWRACNSTLLVARVQTNVVIHCRWYLGIFNRVLAFFCTLFLLACLLLYHKYAVVISTSRRVACTSLH